MSQYLSFHFNLNDANNFTYISILSEEPFLAHAFYKSSYL